MTYQALYVTANVFPLNYGGTMGTFSMYKRISEVISAQMFSLIAKDQLAEAQEFALHNNIRFFPNQVKINLDYYKKKARLSRPVNKKMLEVITSELSKGTFQLVIFDFGTREYFFIINSMFPDVKKIYVSNNAEYLNIEVMLKENAKSKSKIIYNPFMNRLRAALYKNDEKKCCAAADMILSVSEQDSANLAQEFEIDPNKFVFCKPFIQFNKVKEKEDLLQFHKRLLIVGSMAWTFNVEGARWFVSTVFEQLLQRDPEYVLYLVGRDPSPEILALAEKYKGNIVVTGTVEDIDEYYRLCDICLVPVFSGTGVKIKLLEALGKGIPTICHSFSAMGYSGVENAVVIADSPTEIVDAIVRLQKSAEERIKLYERTTAYYQDYMSDDAVLHHALNLLVNS